MRPLTIAALDARKVAAAVPAILLSYDFSQMTAGGSSLPGSLSLTRSAGASGDAAYNGPGVVITGIASDTARGAKLLGTDPLGLLVEESRTNKLDLSTPPTTSGGTSTDWSYAGLGFTFSSVAAAGPDGSAVQRSQGTSGNLGKEVNSLNTGSPFTYSFWAKRNGGGTSYWQRVSKDNNTTHVSQPVTGYGSTWVRSDATYTSSPSTANALGFDLRVAVNPSYDGAACDIYSCFHQVEAGSFPTSPIVGTVSGSHSTRGGDGPRHANGAGHVNGGRVSVLFTVQTLASSAELTSNARLLTFDANNYVEFTTGTAVLKIVVGGVAYSTPVAMSFARNDVLDIWVEFGGGVTATKVEYRVNGGSVTTLSTGSPPVQAVVAPAGGVDLLCDTAGGGTPTKQWTCIARSIAFYNSGKAPVWVV